MAASPSQFKTPSKRSFRYDENAFSSKKRRTSVADTFDVFRHDLSYEVGESSSTMVNETTADRFVPDPKEQVLPLCVTPRSRRLANSVTVTENQRVNVEGNPAKTPSTKPLHPFRKHLTKQLYEVPKPPSFTSALTNLCKDPELTLSAPLLGDDFYSRPISWSASGILAVTTLDSINYRNMHNAEVGSVTKMDPDDDTTCIEWCPESRHLAVGLEGGEVRLFDAPAQHEVGIWITGIGSGHVGGISWRDQHVFSVAYGDGYIRNLDKRIPRQPVISVQAHRARVCGIRWSPDGTFLATGGGDGTVRVWDARGRADAPVVGKPETARFGFQRRWRQRKHSSTVKALAWCPWQPDILASGGGTRDGAIRLWSTAAGMQVRIAETESQVSSLHFAPHCKELVSTHGYAFNPETGGSAQRTHSILVHGYPRLTQVGKIFDINHGRISDSCLSPDGTRLVTSGGDETIRVYRVFGPRKKVERAESEMKSLNIIR